MCDRGFEIENPAFRAEAMDGLNKQVFQVVPNPDGSFAVWIIEWEPGSARGRTSDIKLPKDSMIKLRNYLSIYIDEA